MLKCPYCPTFITQVRKSLWEHIDSDHAEELRREKDGLFGACRRIEHLNGAGVRVVDMDKAYLHWDTVRQVFDKRQRRALRTIGRNLTAEAVTMIGDESSPLQSNFKPYRDLLKKM